MKKVQLFNYSKMLFVLICALPFISSCNGSMFSEAPDATENAISHTGNLLSEITRQGVIREGTNQVVMGANSDEDAQARLKALFATFHVSSSTQTDTTADYTVSDTQATYKIHYVSAPEDPDYFSYAIVNDTKDKTVKIIKFRRNNKTGININDINLWDPVSLSKDLIEGRDSHLSGSIDWTKDCERWNWDNNEINGLCIGKSKNSITVLYLSTEDYTAYYFSYCPTRSKMDWLKQIIQANEGIFITQWNDNVKVKFDYNRMFWLGETCNAGFSRRVGSINGKRDTGTYGSWTQHPYLLVKDVSITSDIHIITTPAPRKVVIK